MPRAGQIAVYHGITRRGDTWLIREDKVDHLGFIPSFITAGDSRPLREQINEAYAHGGGWKSFTGFTLNAAEKPLRAFLTYPGDPAMREVGRCTIRDETCIVFDNAWVVVTGPWGWEVARID